MRFLQSFRTLALAALVATALSACGARPTQQLQDAEGALADARIAEKCAPEEYRAAVVALAKARELADKGEHDEAKLQAQAARKLAVNAKNKAMLRKDECEREGQPAVAAVDPKDFVDQSGPGTGAGSSAEGLKTIFFDFNSFDLTADARQVLAGNAAWLKANIVPITIEGHCDKRGSTEYNLALGEKRANVVRNYLKSLGIPADRIGIISYGEEKPLDWQESESAFGKNRRAEFVVRAAQ